MHRLLKSSANKQGNPLSWTYTGAQLRKPTQISPAPKPAWDHSSAQEGLCQAGVVDRQTLRESKQGMEEEIKLGMKTTDIRQLKLEKDIEEVWKRKRRRSAPDRLLQSALPWVYSLQVHRTNCFSSSPLWAQKYPFEFSHHCHFKFFSLPLNCSFALSL